MSLFGRIDRAARAATATVYGDPLRIMPRARGRDVNAGFVWDMTRPVVEGVTGIVSHRAAVTNEPDAKDPRADRHPGTSQAYHLIEITDPTHTAGNPLVVKVGDVVDVLEGDDAGRWYVTQTTPSDVGGLFLIVNRMD